MMKRKVTRFAVALTLTVTLVALWVLFAPTKLGGSSTYTVTSGISMQPMLVKGDLALVRSEPSYHVGDIVLYNSAVLHEPVLHRIFKIQNGNYFFKGDNNSFVDPGYATRAELVGKLWLHIARVGGFISWVGKPLHSAVLAALAAMAVILSLGRTNKRRQRNRKTSRKARTIIPDFPYTTSASSLKTTANSKEPRGDSSDTPLESASGANTNRHVSSTSKSLRHRSDRKPSIFEGPIQTLTLVTSFMLVAVVCLSIGFTRPLKHLVPTPNAYQMSGLFSYSAVPTTKTPVYPKGVINTGDPIYSSLVKDVTLGFNYTFTSALPHNIKGTITFRALVLSQTNTWKQPFVLTNKTAFTGDTTSIISLLPLKGFYSLIKSVNSQTGASGLSYTADLQPVVHVTGTVGGMPIDETFSPVLPFAVTQQSITLAVASTPAPPGATYVAPTLASQLAATLHPTQPGSVMQLGTNSVMFAKYTFNIALLRTLGELFTALSVLFFGLHERLRRRMPTRTEEEIIAKQLHLTVIPVASLVSTAGTAPIDVPDFLHLGELATFLERPILHERHLGSETFAVDDDIRRYIFRRPDFATNPAAKEIVDDTFVASAIPAIAMDAASTTSVPVAIPLSAKRLRKARGDHGQKSRDTPRVNVAQAAVGVLALAVIFTLSTSFTASSNVSPSAAGASVQVRAVSQLAPAGCSSLNLVSLVKGSGVFSNALSNALILGSAGNDTITDTGNHDCIVGGGGNNAVSGTSSDICVTGATLNIAGPCTTPSNGATATPSTSNTSDSAGQELLSIANDSSITSMTITISIAATAGLSYLSQSNGFPNGKMSQSHSSSSGVITYTYALKDGKTIAAGSPSGDVVAGYSVLGTAHPLTGDTWSVTSTSGGIISTSSGNFH